MPALQLLPARLLILAVVAAACGGADGAASAGPARIRVDAAKHGFVDAAGRPFMPCGVSYYRPGTGWAPQLSGSSSTPRPRAGISSA